MSRNSVVYPLLEKEEKMVNNPIQKIIDQYRVVLLDGAIATEIEKKGVNIQNELWSANAVIDNPESIKQVHTDYFKAGADIATTNTYQASIDGFKRNGWTIEEAEKLIEKTVSIAKDARDEFWGNISEQDKMKRPFPLIAGSIGPYGAFLANGAEYTGEYELSDKEFEQFHLPRMKQIKDAQADLFAFETMPNFKESKVLANLLQSYFPNDFAWLSFSISDEKHISDGTPLKEAVSYFNSYPNICAIGINCTSILHIPEVILELKEVTTKPIVIYPNAGGSYDAVTKTWTDEKDDDNYGNETRHWHDSGVELIGGCCRTTPHHIQQIKKWARD
ncbi:homocysteine S-methyltransferase [Niallia sp. 03133]|uniref:homocysteine S-methyltransferase n=1 Tax=Niallia sp. 03133 TaxID=3458060 RepID=UPI0040446607